MLPTKQRVRKNRWYGLGGLAVLTAVGLFPYGWLNLHWPWFAAITQRLFESEVVHIVCHIGLFALLGMGVLQLVPRLSQHLGIYLGLMLLVGLVQEFLQLATFKSRPFGLSDLFDLGTDLVGAAIGYWLFCQQRSRPSAERKIQKIRRTE